MNKRCFSLYLDFGSLIVIMIQISNASATSSNRQSFPVNQRKVKDKSLDLQQRSETMLLDEHLKLNPLLKRNFDSNEKLFSRQVNQHFLQPELILNKMPDLKTNRFSDKQFSFNFEENLNQGRDHHVLSNFNSPHLKDGDFELEEPVFTPDLAQKYQRELHETLKTHQQILHEALKNNHNNLHHALRKSQIQNAQKLNRNKYDIQGSLSSGPNEESPFQNDHIPYNHENIKPQTDNSYIPPPSSPVSSFVGPAHNYDVAHSPISNNDYDKQGHNNVHGHINAYMKPVEPHQGVKTDPYSSNDDYYETEKINRPPGQVNQNNDYATPENEGIVGNKKSEYSQNVYHDGKRLYTNNITPNQYDLGSNLHNSKNNFDPPPHNYQSNKNQNGQHNYGGTDGSLNTNNQRGHNYSPHRGPVLSVQNNPHGPMPYSEHINLNQQNHHGEVMNKQNKNGNSYSQGYGAEVNRPAFYNGPNQNDNPNNRNKNNNPQVYNINGEHNNNGQKNYDSHNPHLNNGHPKAYSLNKHDNSQGIRQVSNHKLYNKGQSFNNQINNNKRYNNEEYQHGYGRGPPAGDRKMYNKLLDQGKDHYDSRSKNTNYPVQQNRNGFNGKNSHNAAPVVSHNKSGYVPPNQHLSNAKRNNVHDVRYSPHNQNAGHQLYQNNFNNNGNAHNSGNNNKNDRNSSINSSNGTGYHKASFARRKLNPLEVPSTSSKPNTSKVTNAPIIHHIYLSEPLINGGMF